MSKSAVVKTYNEHGSKFNLSGDFDGLQTFQEIQDLMPPVGSVDKLVLDFTHVSNVKPIEVYALLAEMAAVSRFSELKIDIEGLQFDAVYSDDYNELAQNIIIIPAREPK